MPIPQPMVVILRTRDGRRDTRGPVHTAPVPPAIAPRGLGGDRLMLHRAHQTYGLGVPFYRPRWNWLGQGVDLSTATACSWMGHPGRGPTDASQRCVRYPAKRY